MGPLWDGAIQWQEPGKGAFQAFMTASPSSSVAREVYGAERWPAVLQVRQFCYLKDIEDRNRITQAPRVKLLPSRTGAAAAAAGGVATGEVEKNYGLLYQCLCAETWNSKSTYMAVVSLDDKEMLIYPTNEKILVGLLLPAMLLSAASSGVATGSAAVTAATSLAARRVGGAVGVGGGAAPPPAQQGGLAPRPGMAPGRPPGVLGAAAGGVGGGGGGGGWPPQQPPNPQQQQPGLYPPLLLQMHILNQTGS
jgi:hypothetical protein